MIDPAETLSIGLVDMTGDGAGIWVANDSPCTTGLDAGKRWLDVIEPFKQTSHSTMSLDWGDLLNRGKLAYFTTDMAPYDTSPEVMAQWQPLMDAMGMGDTAMHDTDLHHERTIRRSWPTCCRCHRDAAVCTTRLLARCRCHRLVMGCTLWRSGCGWLPGSLCVNGVIASDMFGHLHNNELIEENQAFRNHGNGSFART